MPHERSNDQASHVPNRAVANQHNASGVSRLAVQAVQRTMEDKSAGEEAVIQEPAERSAMPKAFTLPTGNKNTDPALPVIQPFQLKPTLPHAVVQRKRIFVTTSTGPRKQVTVREIDHKDLIAAVKKKMLIRKGGILINIGTEEEWYVPINDLIQSVKDSMAGIDEDDYEDLNRELDALQEELSAIRDGDKKGSRKRKRRKSSPTPKKKYKAHHGEAANDQVENIEQEEDTLGGQHRVEDTVNVDEKSQKPEKPKEALKFVAWNANHFGKGNALDEKQILSAIKRFAPLGDVTKMKKNEEFGYTSSQIESFLQVLSLYSGALPVYSKITEVNLLMEAVKSLKYILERLGNNENREGRYYAGKHKIIAEIAGSLKKHYMLVHSKHLLEVHPNLVMGFNEVGEGIGVMKGRLEGKIAGKDEDKGIQLQQGPQLQSISINVGKLNTAIRKHNKEDEEELDTVPKKKQYTDQDLWDHYQAYKHLGKPEEVLRRSQIEYYPIAFNSGKYEYKGYMTISGSLTEENKPNVTWTKNPHFTKYITFRPIVVHKLVIRKDKKDKKDKEDKKENEIWYGMVHTTPDGDEFDRREIYEEQLSVSLPKLKNLARSANAQLIIGGDYYIAEEALIKPPSVLRTQGNTYETETDNDFRMSSREISDQKLSSGKSIGWSDRDEDYFTGTNDQVRNLLHPGSHDPYNFKNTLKNEKLKDVRSLTGTNENNLGLQSADYFIIDRKTSKTYQSGVIDPVTGLPFFIESDNREMSDAWFSFSDHVPVMIVVSAEKDDKAVSGAFPDNKGYFNSDPYNSNLFDLRFLQISNAMTRITQKESGYPEETVKSMKETFDAIKGKRKSGSHTEEDLILMNKLKTETDKLLAQESKHLDISTAMFETYQASEAYITTILHQIWTDIYSIKLDHEKSSLLDHIQDVRLIFKEEKINTAYSIGLNQDSQETKEALQTLQKYLKKGSLDEIDTSHEKIKGKEDDMDIPGFISLKQQLQQELLHGLMADIGKYISASEEDAPSLEGKEYENIVLNYKLLGDIVGNKTTTHSIRKQHETCLFDEEPDLYDLQDSSEEARHKGGIPNRGNDCFLNSLCQLLTLPAYKELLLDSTVRGFIGKVDNKEKISRAEVWELRLHLYTLNRVKTMGGQEDAAELLGKLMDEIDYDKMLDPTTYEETFKVLASDKRTILESTNRSDINNNIIDESIEEWHGGVKTTDQHPENILNIPVEGTAGLIDWLNQSKEYTFAPKYDEPNTIEWAAMNGEWHSVLKRSERTIFKHLPSVLTIALKRFNNSLQKIAQPFNMPEGFWLYEEKEGTFTQKVYSLQGFIYHQGDNLKGGHYWTHKKDKEGNWVKAEDSRVNPSDMESTDTEGALKHDIDRAYIYTYVLTGNQMVEDSTGQDNEEQVSPDTVNMEGEQ